MSNSLFMCVVLYDQSLTSNETVETDFDLIDFNVMSTRRGVIYAKRLVNLIPRTFAFAFLYRYF